MNKVESFIEKWNIGYEDLEQKEEFANEMKSEIAQIKEDVSCKFKEWCDNNEHEYYYVNPYRCYTTSELYQEFIKTL